MAPRPTSLIAPDLAPGPNAAGACVRWPAPVHTLALCTCISTCIRETSGIFSCTYRYSPRPRCLRHRPIPVRASGARLRPALTDRKTVQAGGLLSAGPEDQSRNAPAIIRNARLGSGEVRLVTLRVTLARLASPCGSRGHVAVPDTGPFRRLTSRAQSASRMAARMLGVRSRDSAWVVRSSMTCRYLSTSWRLSRYMALVRCSR